MPEKHSIIHWVQLHYKPKLTLTTTQQGGSGGNWGFWVGDKVVGIKSKTKKKKKKIKNRIPKLKGKGHVISGVAKLRKGLQKGA